MGSRIDFERNLLEFFLIDTQMSTCMQASRTRQAIAAVQLPVWRCQGAGAQVNGNALDRDSWAWMGEFNSWYQNRRLFVFPEDGLDGWRRDDKSPFYRDLESALLQKDIDSNLIQAALSAYIYKVDEIANLAVAGIYVVEDSRGAPTLAHIFARTRNLPAKIYYRRFDFVAREWSAWERVQIEIPTYSDQDPADPSGRTTITGLYLCPVVWENRLFIFFPEFTSKSTPDKETQQRKISDSADHTPEENKDGKYWEIKFAWSEYRSGAWTQKQVSNDGVLHGQFYGYK